MGPRPQGGTLLSRASISLMFKPAYGFSDYGLGWRIEVAGRGPEVAGRGPEVAGRSPVVQHSGAINGGASHIYRDTGRDRTVIILSNVQNADLASLREKALELFKTAR